MTQAQIFRKGRPVLSQREESKNERRTRILKAARMFLLEGGELGWSMEALAKRAEVSPGTPYNLFGTKQAILIRLLEEEFAAFSTRIRQAKMDPIERLFFLIEVTTEINRTREQYTRNLSRALMFSGAEIRSVLTQNHLEKPWTQIIGQARTQGLLADDTDASMTAVILIRIYLATLTDFASGYISLEDYETQCGYGFALCLLGLTTKAGQPKVRQYLDLYAARGMSGAENPVA